MSALTKRQAGWHVAPRPWPRVGWPSTTRIVVTVEKLPNGPKLLKASACEQFLNHINRNRLNSRSRWGARIRYLKINFEKARFFVSCHRPADDSSIGVQRDSCWQCSRLHGPVV